MGRLVGVVGLGGGILGRRGPKKKIPPELLFQPIF